MTPLTFFLFLFDIRKMTFDRKPFVGANGQGLTLETSASESLYDGQFTLSTQLIKPNFLVIPTEDVKMW